MAEGLVRWQREGDLHFVTMSCFHRSPLLDGCYSLAEDALERTRLRYGMAVLGYVLMPEHLHVIVSEPSTGVLADAMKMFKLSVANRQAVRPFWQKRYYDRNLCTHNAMVECLRYTHRNPVARGLVREAEEWPWSSYRHYLLGETRRVTVDSEWSRVEAAWKGFEEPVEEVDTGEFEM